MVEVHAVDACCDHDGSRVSQGRNPSCNVDKFEDCAAVDVSHRIGVYRHHLTRDGVTIAANKIRGVRAALCWDAETTKGARMWDDANVLAMSLRSTSIAVAKEILDSWFSNSAVTTGIDAELIDRAKALDAKYLHSTAK